jgi:hypothetical protein
MHGPPHSSHARVTPSNFGDTLAITCSPEARSEVGDVSKAGRVADFSLPK